MHRALESISYDDHERSPLEDVSVIMPIGGLATRAHGVTQDLIPKHLIQLGDGRPVLEHVLGGLQTVGFREFIFCVGRHKDQIIDYIKAGKWSLGDAEYHFSEEEELLGPDGAVRQAIDQLGVQGQAMVIPGDMLLPWRGLAKMNEYHSRNNTAVTFGVTSHITERTTDVGKFVVENDTNRLLWCYPRDAKNLEGDRNGSRGLTSAAAMAITVSEYTDMIDSFVQEKADQPDKKISFRDDIAPWLIGHNEFRVHAYDVQGEALDLGTPQNIAYGTNNWQNYV